MSIGGILPRGELTPFQFLQGPRRPCGVSSGWALGERPLGVHRQLLDGFLVI